MYKRQGLITHYGWPSVFYIFGGLGVVWWMFWTFRAHSTPAEDPQISKSELDFLNKNTAVSKVLSLQGPVVYARGRHQLPRIDEASISSC